MSRQRLYLRTILSFRLFPVLDLRNFLPSFQPAKTAYSQEQSRSDQLGSFRNCQSLPQVPSRCKESILPQITAILASTTTKLSDIHKTYLLITAKLAFPMTKLV